MLPFQSLISLQKQAKTPLFLQIAHGLMDNIKNGVIPKSTKLLGSRAMANALGVNRQTVVAAYDELLAQGWIETKASKGTFVSSKIPVFKPISLDKQLIQKDLSIHIAEGKTTTGFHFNKKDHLTLPILRGVFCLEF